MCGPEVSSGAGRCACHEGFFLAVELEDGVMLDYAEPGVPFPSQHIAFLVSGEDGHHFEAITRPYGSGEATA